MSDLQDLAALIRADTPLIVVETADETRVVDLFRQTLIHVWRAMYRWSVTEGLRRIDGVQVLSQDTNMVFVRFPDDACQSLSAALREQGILVRAVYGGPTRMVTHRDVSAQDVDKVVAAIGRYYARQPA